MIKKESNDRTIYEIAADPPVIQYFGIVNLHGYRSISLSSENAATILIARNGTGKTTLLGALDAFLRLQLSRLRNLEFSEIRCRLTGETEDLVLYHADVIDFLQIPVDGDIGFLAGRANVEPSALFNFIIEDWEDGNYRQRHNYDGGVYSSIVSAFDYNRREASVAIEKVRQILLERNPSILSIYTVLKKCLKGCEIVYLPTYRRIELALRGDPRETQRRRKRPRFEVAAGSLFTGEIQFGLTDISERLSELNQQIIIESNEGYRKISADIINELLDGSFEADASPHSEVPEREELRVFFERLENGRRQGPYPPISIPNLTKIYTREGLATSSSKFLSYFLSKLATIIRSTKAVEQPVDDFIMNCNKYLSSNEPSTDIITSKTISADGKVLRLNRSNFRVHVESVPGNRRISLDALSSGEKQMVSLFAKMFLYPNRKIVLIDEPELSLSIDWQREILVDVLGAPSCAQLIAITHSPFVFDNDLEPFAGALKIEESIHEVASDEYSEDDIDE